MMKLIIILDIMMFCIMFIRNTIKYKTTSLREKLRDKYLSILFKSIYEFCLYKLAYILISTLFLGIYLFVMACVY